MALSKPRIMYGFEVTAGSNDKLDFVNAGVTYVATLNPGVYTAKGLEVEAQRAIRAVDSGHSVTVTFDHVTKTFTVGAGTAAFSLLFSTGANHAATCANLLEFAANSDQTLATTYTSSPVGTVWSGGQIAANPATGTLWDWVDPVTDNAPSAAQAAGTAAKLLPRKVTARQSVSDGNVAESVYINTTKVFWFQPDTVQASEQTKLEAWLDWAMQGKPFTYLPDATVGTAVLHLVFDLSSPNINNAFSWFTRTETNYGKLFFIEQEKA